AYSEIYGDHINIAQFSINHSKDDILRGIYLEQADVVAFSCYIWNIGLILRVIKSLRKIQPQVKIWFGGPEVSYYPKEYLLKYQELDGIVIGEGEETFYELTQYYLNEGRSLDSIDGIAYKDSAKLQLLNESLSNGITITSPRKSMALDKLPFAYENMESHKNKII